jgi:hypothetical protein
VPPRDEPTSRAEPPPEGARARTPHAGAPGPASGGRADEEQLAELQRQLVETPASSVVANHCYGLFELAALHLSTKPPRLDQARTAIDALGCLVEGMKGRLGPEEKALSEGLAQIRLAFVQIDKSARAGDGSDSPG